MAQLDIGDNSGIKSLDGMAFQQAWVMKLLTRAGCQIAAGYILWRKSGP